MRKRERILCFCLGLLLLFALLCTFINVARYPERYSAKLRYQLLNDLKRGDELATEYYESVYLSRGIELFLE